MSTLERNDSAVTPVSAKVTDDTLSVDLADGRTISAPIAWFPRLLHGSAAERQDFRIGRNGIHWEKLDEDIPVIGLLNGEKSGESLTSIQRWLASRHKTN